MNEREKVLWKRFEKWIGGEEGVKAIHRQGGNIQMINPYSNVCPHSLAGEAFIAGHKDGEKVLTNFSLYRELVIEKAIHYEDAVCMSFKNSIVSLQIRKEWLKDKYVNPGDLVVGRHILIKARIDSRDVFLASPNSIENLVLMPMID